MFVQYFRKYGQDFVTILMVDNIFTEVTWFGLNSWLNLGRWTVECLWLISVREGRPWAC